MTLDLTHLGDRLFRHPYTLSFVGAMCATYVLTGANSFVAVLRHEAAHILAAVLTLRRPVGLQVQANGGGLAQFRGGDSWFISLAPYFLPVATVPLLVLGLLGVASGDLYAILLGVTSGFDVAVATRQFGYHQSDLQYAGPIRSTLLTISMLIAVWTFVMLFGVLASVKGACHLYMKAAELLVVWGEFVVQSLIGEA